MVGTQDELIERLAALNEGPQSGHEFTSFDPRFKVLEDIAEKIIPFCIEESSVSISGFIDKGLRSSSGHWLLLRS